MRHKWFIIVNVRSGAGQGGKDWGEISGLLAEMGVEFEYSVTKYQGHALELVLQAVASGYRYFISVGGDGTANEVANGILIQKAVPSVEIVLGVISVGTGNDWGKTVGIPKDYQRAISAITQGTTMVQDVGLIRYDDGQKLQQRYFVNVAGMGYDAKVCYLTNCLKERGKSGAFLYLVNLFLCLIKYKTTKVQIKVDGKSYEGMMLSLTVGIGKFNGGGMMQLPEALPDDGLFDLTLIGNVSKFDVLKNVKRLFDGSLLTHPKVKQVRGKKISISSEPAIAVEVDGESLGISQVEFEIFPAKLKIIVENAAENLINNRVSEVV